MNNILNKPKFVKDVGNIYPVTMNDYDEFMDKANIITVGYQHFNLDEIKNSFGIEDIKLLDLVTILARQEDESEDINNNKALLGMCDLFSIILHVERVSISYHFTNEYGLLFKIGQDRMIHRENYDEVRSVIMEQNLLFEAKVYKNEIIQKWANKVLEARAKNGIDIDMEDYLTTIASASSKHYWDLANYTLYQVKSEFARIGKFKAFETNLALIGHSTSIGNDHYAEKTDIQKNPYDDVFVDDSKLSGMKSGLGGG